MRHFFVFGNHPNISREEVRAVFDIRPSMSIKSISLYKEKMDLRWANETLGGLVKAGDIVWEGKQTDFDVSVLADWIKKHNKQNKLLFGLTVVAESNKDAAKYRHLPIQLKKALKPLGKKVRWVTGERGEIRPVTIQKMKLIDKGHDFLILLDKHKLYIGKTTVVQDANAWSDRDYGRPFRDAKTGMLPPKLARMMANVAIGSKPKKGARLLDPFCGAGTILMEAAMRSPELTLIGSDIDGKQVRGAERNMQWLTKQGHVSKDTGIEWITSSVQDIKKHIDTPVHFIVTEGFLGRPLQGRESKRELEQNMHEVETIWREGLPVLAGLQPGNGKLVCIWPEYQARGDRVELDVTKAAQSAGYKRLDKNDLVYGREGQHVLRKIVILEKK